MNNDVVKIVTHNGQFHADDVLACALLKLIIPNSDIFRTRNDNIINNCEYVVDVGRIYNPDNNRFDHHQKGCYEVYSKNYDTPMSSVGMVYKKFGKDIIETLLKQYNGDIEKVNINYITNTMYKSFIKEIDCIDNGISNNSLNETNNNEKNKYFITTNFSSTINKFNSIDSYDHNEQMVRFSEAMDYAILMFKVHLFNYIDKSIVFEKDGEIVKIVMEERFKYDKDGQIIVFTTQCTNSMNHIKSYEKTNEIDINSKNSIKYVIYLGDTDEYRIRAMPSDKIFVNRRNLKTKEELEQLDETLKDKIIFIHNCKFVGGTKDLESAIKIAQLSLLD
jgi:uncharacterized UPF0160 family protein